MAATPQRNALITAEAPPQEAEAELFYTLPSLHETPDDRRYFRRMEALFDFPRALPVGTA